MSDESAREELAEDVATAEPDRTEVHLSYDGASRLVRGEGSAELALAANLRRQPVRLGAAVTTIDRRATPLRAAGPWGAVTADRVIVAVPTNVLAEERLRFDPPLHVAVGAGSVAFVYRSVNGLLAVETLIFDETGRVSRAHCHYSAP